MSGCQSTLEYSTSLHTSITVRVEEALLVTGMDERSQVAPALSQRDCIEQYLGRVRTCSCSRNVGACMHADSNQARDSTRIHTKEVWTHN